MKREKRPKRQKRERKKRERWKRIQRDERNETKTDTGGKTIKNRKREGKKRLISLHREEEEPQ
jgi:hypothetical protein